MSVFTAHADDIVIVGASRTPQGKILGALSSFSASDLGTFAVKQAVQDSGLKARQIDYLYMGQVLLAGSGQNPARQVGIKAGLSWSMPSEVVNKVCLSGLTAINNAARLIRSGEAKIVVAGGQESMSQAPHLLLNSRKGFPYGDTKLVDSLNHDGLIDSFDDLIMGYLTDTHAEQLEISRDIQDQYAFQSHTRAARAIADGVFDDEIVQITIPQKRGEDLIVTEDEGVRKNTTLQDLAKLKPAFRDDGTITAGSSSQLSDGAAAVVLTTRSHADSLGLPILAALSASSRVAGPDNSLPKQPSHAIDVALKRAQIELKDIDLFEINEAFSAVVLQSVKDLGVDIAQVNIHGGAIAQGHPVGASGARLVVHLAHTLKRREKGTAIASLCGGGGQGEALILWR